MKKKGATHVDWIISISMFIIFVLFLFILIQPSFTPVYDLSELANSVDSYLKKAGEWNLDKTAIFLGDSSGQPQGVIYIKDQWPFDYDVSTPDKFAIFDKNLNEINSRININGNLLTADEVWFLGTPGNFYWLYYSFDASFSHTTFANNDYQYVYDDLINNNIDYELGATESLIGFNIDKLNDLAIICQNDYETAKDMFGLPETKEFAIYYVYDQANAIYDFEMTEGICNWDYDINNPYTNVAPYEQANIYVKEYLYWILEANGDTTPILINIRVW